MLNYFSYSQYKKGYDRVIEKFIIQNFGSETFRY